jgi:alanine racemase
MLFRTLRYIRDLLYPRSNPLIEVGISKAALLHNLHTYQAANPTLRIAPVLKSNAYGHDLGLVARVLDPEDIAFFMVDSIYEARRLRQAGARSRIVVMGYARPADIAENTLRAVDFALTDIEQLSVVARYATRAVRVHLKIDTGMHRQGILPEQIEEAVSILASNPLLQVVGVCSHFADADSTDPTHTHVQLARWKDALATLTEHFPDIEYRHLAATKGMRFAQEAGTNVARLGIGLYGYDTSPGGDSALQPVLELRSLIGELRTIAAGESVGYNTTYSTSKETKVATIPAGYFEGVDRRLSNTGFVTVRGVQCPIIGRVSMNMTSVDVSTVPNVAVGDSVILISRNLASPNSVPEIARLISSEHYRESEYVIPTHVPQHLKRVLE